MEKEQEMEKPEKFVIIIGVLLALIIAGATFYKLPKNGAIDSMLSAAFVSGLAGVMTYFLVAYLISKLIGVKNN